MQTGEEQAWGILSGLDPDDIYRRAEAVFDRSSGLYARNHFFKMFSSRRKRDRYLDRLLAAASQQTTLVAIPGFQSSGI